VAAKSEKRDMFEAVQGIVWLESSCIFKVLTLKRLGLMQRKY
jgi:hypothetical protein